MDSRVPIDLNPPAVLTGLAIGDALGMPFETCSPTDSRLVSWTGEYAASTHHGLNPGQYTDDTQMAVALSTSLLMAGEYNPANAAAAYRDWFHRDPRGIGGTIKRAMERLDAGEAPAVSGRYDASESTWIGNGVSMRIAPLGLFYASMQPLSALLLAVEADAAITHQHPDAVHAATAVAVAVRHAVRERRTGVLGTVLTTLARTATPTQSPRLMRRLAELLFELARGTAPSSLFDADDAVGISALALYIVDVTGCYEEAVTTAIRLGGDTDTRAAIVGAIAGAAYGLEAIPPAWFQNIENRDMLVELDATLPNISKVQVRS